MIEFIRIRILPTKTAQLFIQTFLKWQQDNCSEMGAALAYYALFSLFPIFLVILSIFGFFLGPNSNAARQVLSFAQGALPSEAFKIVENTLVYLNQSSVGAGLVGFCLLMLTASRIFGALDDSVDRIWQVETEKASDIGLKKKAINFVLDKILAFVMVLSTAVFILLSLLSNIAIGVILQIAKNFEQEIAWFEVNDWLLIKGLQAGISFLLLTLVIMGLFKILPSTLVYWGDIWLGAAFSSGLLMFLQRLVSSGVVQIGEQFRAYGVIGGVMVLLLWLYLTCQIFFFGCEFTYVYTHLFGSRSRVPSSD